MHDNNLGDVPPLIVPILFVYSVVFSWMETADITLSIVAKLIAIVAGVMSVLIAYKTLVKKEDNDLH